MTRPTPRIARSVPRGRRKVDPRRAAKHLAFIRLLPCMVCGIRPSEAAHVRSSKDGGTGMKPGDRFTLPLCTAHHDTQHAAGELAFWSHYRIDPLDAAERLWTVSGDLKAGERIVFRARQAIGLRSQIIDDPAAPLPSPITNEGNR